MEVSLITNRAHDDVRHIPEMTNTERDRRIDHKTNIQDRTTQQYPQLLYTKVFT